MWNQVSADINSYKVERNTSFVKIYFQRNAPTVIIEQSLVYTFTNFVAEFGGYLGLLLGASLLSIYDDIWSFFANFNAS